MSFLENWYEAGPLYEKAERMFSAQGDTYNEIYARIGRVRAQANSTGWREASRRLARELQNAIVTSDPRLRLWCLVSKGYIDNYLSIANAHTDWTQAMHLAGSLGDNLWFNRAEGELGINEFFEANVALAESLAGRAIRASEGGDPAGEARLLAMAGEGYNQVGRFRDANWFFQESSALVKNIPNAGFPYLTYEGQAEVWFGEGKVQQASALLRTVLSEARREGRLDEQAEVSLELGELALRTGDPRSAKPYFEEAERIASSIQLTSVLANTYFDMFSVYRQAADPRHAAATLAKALEASRQLAARYYLPRDLRARAQFAAGAEKNRAADRLYTEAEDAIEVMNFNSDRGNTALAGAMSETYLEHFRLAISHRNYDRAFQVLERVRGRVMLTRLLYPRTKLDTETTRSSETKLIQLQLALRRTTDSQIRSSLLDQLEETERIHAFEDNEATLHKRYTVATPASLQQVQRILMPNELLLEYVAAEPQAFCVAVTRDQVRVLSLALGGNGIAKLTKTFLLEIKSKNFDRSHASELYASLLEPALSLFPRSRIVIVPDGLLHFLPFEGLLDREGRFVVQSHTVSYAPSASVLRFLRVRKNVKAPRSLLAVGDVKYQGRRFSPVQLSEARGVTRIILRGLAGISGSPLSNLPESRDEVLSLAKIAGPTARILLGSDATESQFKSQPLSDFRVLHLAVHAMADPQFPDRAALILAPDPSDTEDGLLQVPEIGRLTLNSDLVTLSACETGIGALEGEAGVLSLRDAFLMAGARTVVSTLWDVEDQSAATFMKEFYAHLAAHEDKATAITHAKRDLLGSQTEEDPYYWAGFVMAGEGNDTVSFGHELAPDR